MKIIDSRTFKRLVRENNYKAVQDATLVKDYNTTPEILDERHVRFVISDETVDRHGDIVKLSAWNFDHYLRNPVVLWNHDDGLPPLGRCVDLKKEGDKLKATVRFVPRDMPVVGEQAEMVLRMCREGFLNATSVGFIAKDWTEVNDKSRGDTFDPGVDFTDVDMLEFSIVPLPANPNALIDKADKSQLIKDSDILPSTLNRLTTQRLRRLRQLEILRLS